MAVTANFAGPVQTDGSNHFRMLQSMARSYIGVAQSIPNNITTALTLDTNEINTDGMWSGGANTRLTAPIAGKYLILAGVDWAGSSAGTYRQIFIRANGQTAYGGQQIGAGASVPIQMAASDIIQLNAGGYVEICVAQDSGGALDAQADRRSFGAMVYLGE